MRKVLWICGCAVCVAGIGAAPLLLQEKGGEPVTGPYEVVVDDQRQQVFEFTNDGNLAAAIATSLNVKPENVLLGVGSTSAKTKLA